MCQVPVDQIVSVHDCPSVYHVPMLLQSQNVIPKLMELLQMELPVDPQPGIQSWLRITDMYDSSHKVVKIALVGKYTRLEDAYISVVNSLQHAALACHRKLELKYVNAENLEATAKRKDKVNFHEAWASLCGVDGVIVPGGFGTRAIEGKIAAAEYCRTHNVPFLGVCLGFQCAVIEFARNVMKWPEAHTTEINPHTEHKVIVDMPEHTGKDMGKERFRGFKKRINVFLQVEQCVSAVAKPNSSPPSPPPPNSTASTTNNQKSANDTATATKSTRNSSPNSNQKE